MPVVKSTVPKMDKKPVAKKLQPKVKVTAKNPDLKHQDSTRPKLKGKATHSGARAAEIVIRPPIKIFREETDIAVVAWGRMNPPTKGHERLVQTVAELAEEHGAFPMLFLSPSKQDAKNPLSYSERLYLAEEAFGDYVNIEEAAEVTDPIKLLKYVSERFDKVIVVTGQEHEADYDRFFETYNGTEFTFEEMGLYVVERNQESEELAERISATQMRAHAMAGNLEEFTAGLPEQLQEQAEYVMDIVRFGQSLNEVSYSNPVVQAIVDFRNKNV